MKGNIRVFGRVRPITKEDGEGPEAANAVTFDTDDDAILHLIHKGKMVSFELDKVFPPEATQEDVRITNVFYHLHHLQPNAMQFCHRQNCCSRSSMHIIAL